MARRLLDYNNLNITEIEEDYFQQAQFQNLTLINLSYNNITNLPDNVFRSNSALKVLNLSFNLLDDLHFSLKYLIHLNILNLNSNLFENFSKQTFEKNIELIKLQLNSNSFTKLHKNWFSNLYNLRFLYLKNNKISKLNTSFDSLVNLEILDLSFNEIAYISNSLKYNTALKTLYLNSNKLFIVTKKCLAHLINLKELHLCDQTIQSGDKNIFKSNTYLKELYLSNTQLPLRSFKKSNNLHTLVLNGNNINDTDLRLIFHHLTNLKHLNVERANITMLNDYTLSRKHPLEFLKISNNTLLSTLSCEFFSQVTHLMYLNINKCHSISQFDI